MPEIEMVDRSCGLLVRAVRENDREADFVASTDAIDSYDEVVEQVWRLDRFLKNPVALFAHRSYDLPIGQATKCGVVNGQLECTIRFASEAANPLAEKVWQSIREKTLRAVSVGFRPHDVRWEKRNDKDVYVLSDNELFEISVTPIPANPEALAKQRAFARDQNIQKGQPNMATEDTKIAEKLGEREAELRAKDAEIKAKDKEIADVAVKVKALETQNATLVVERDAALKRATDAEDALVVAEVDSLIGKKLLPVERESFVELAKTNKTLFRKMVEQRSDLNLLGPPVIPPETKSPPPQGHDATDVSDVTDFYASKSA